MIVYFFCVTDNEDIERGKLPNGTASVGRAVGMVNGTDLIYASREEDLNAVPETELLDVSANKTKGQLGNSGSLSSRRPPTKSGPPSVSHFNKADAPREICSFHM